MGASHRLSHWKQRRPCVACQDTLCRSSTETFDLVTRRSPRSPLREHIPANGGGGGDGGCDGGDGGDRHVTTCVSTAVLPTSSDAVNWRSMTLLLFVVVTPIVMLPQLSCAVAFSRCMSSVQCIDTSGGMNVNAGAVVSCTVIVCVAETVFVESSLAVNVRITV